MGALRLGQIQRDPPEAETCEAHPNGCRLTGRAYIAGPRLTKEGGATDE